MFLDGRQYENSEPVALTAKFFFNVRQTARPRSFNDRHFYKEGVNITAVDVYIGYWRNRKVLSGKIVVMLISVFFIFRSEYFVVYKCLNFRHYVHVKKIDFYQICQCQPTLSLFSRSNVLSFTAALLRLNEVWTQNEI